MSRSRRHNAATPLPSLIEAMRELERPVPPHPNEAAAEARTLGERIADGVAAVAGSWTFIFIFLGLLAAWITANVLVGLGAIDPFPFILLNLALSCVAALQAPVIMMSQNRQAARDRLHADLDYRVNIRTELELVQMRAELESLRQAQWQALVAMQEEQLALLKRLAEAIERAGGPA